MARKLTRRAKSALNKKKFREARKGKSSSRKSRKSSSGGKRRSKKRGKKSLSKKEWLARRIQTGHDYSALKKYRSSNYGPVPFELQPSWLRAKKGKKYRAKRSRWAKARSSR